MIWGGGAMALYPDEILAVGFYTEILLLFANYGILAVEIKVETLPKK